ncbi:MAG: phosphohistidine phosphatase SixA [Cyanobacteria bacterium P01_E01_bin.34]
MQLIVIRHGIAVDRAIGVSDADRALTPKGRKRTQAIAQWLKQRWQHWDVLLSSPLVRACQTAEIVREAGLVSDVEVLDALAPGGSFQELVTWKSVRQDADTVAIVGHQPDLVDWIELSVWGQTCGRIQLKKAGVAVVDFPAGRMRSGEGVLCEVWTPKGILG